MSLAEAWPAFTKKLACRLLTRASPTDRPLSPNSSIMRPAEAPGGFLKMQPALFCPSGWLERRFSLQIRSEEHTSELQSQSNLVCRLLLEKKKQSTNISLTYSLTLITTTMTHITLR